MKPILILQLRPVAKAADNEYEAFLKHGEIKPEEAVRVEMYKQAIPLENISDFSGIIVGGGPACVSDKEKAEEVLRFEAQLKELVDKVVELDMPYLGACYGMGSLNHLKGGIVCKDKDAAEEVGAIDVLLTEEGKKDPLLKDLPEKFRAFVGHKESCVEPAEGAVILARSERCPIHMLRIKNHIYGTQFHPELDAEGICVRADVYKHAGYFPPEEAEPLKARLRKEVVDIPPTILKRWVKMVRELSVEGLTK